MNKGKVRKWGALLLCVLVLFGIAAKPTQDWPEDWAILHGFVFHDLNANGVRDEGEPGVGGVNFTATCNNETSIDFYSEPRTVQFGNTYLTGDFGPVLSGCNWNVAMHVPEGYVPTTDTEIVVSIPEQGDQATPFYFGLRTGSYLPATGAGMGEGLRVAAGILGLPALIGAALGLFTRKRR
jgi:hypothetical protein